MTILLTITRDNVEQDVDVEFEHERASRGQRDKFGVPLEPDYPESINFIGCDVELTKHEIEKAREKAQDLIDAQRWAGR